MPSPLLMRQQRPAGIARRAPLRVRAAAYHETGRLEHFPEKWTPVFRQKMRPLKKK
jgi:hypothetical protein